MPTPVLGIAKRKFKVGQLSSFRVYGENLDDTTVSLAVKLASTKFNWNPPMYVVNDGDRKKHYVVIHTTPSAGAPAPGAALTSTSDELTVTLTFDPSGPDEDVIEEDYDIGVDP